MSASQMPSSILFVDQYASVGGGQVLLLEMLGFALSQGHRVVLMAPSGGELQTRARERFGTQITWLNCPPIHLQSSRKGISDFWELFRYTVQFRSQKKHLRGFDRIHVNGPRLFLPVMMAAGGRSRVLLHLHLNHSYLEKLLFAGLSCLPTFRRAIAVSSFVFTRLPPLLRRKTTLVPNWLPQADQLTLSAINTDLNRPRIAVVVGRLSTEKGQELVLQAARSLPEWRFLFIGSSAQGQKAYEEDLRSKAPENCAFLGESRTPWDLSQQRGAQVALVPSQWEEPFGLVALEAYVRGFMTAVCPRGGLADLAQQLQLPTFENAVELVSLLRGPPIWPQMPQREALRNSAQRASKELQTLWS